MSEVSDTLLCTICIISVEIPQDSAFRFIGYSRSFAKRIFDGAATAAAGKPNVADGRIDKEV